MIMMFHEIKHKIQHKLTLPRAEGIDFDEVFYADDTICIGTDTRKLNEFIREIEVLGEKYGLRLNKGKCEVLHNAQTANIHFANGQIIQRKSEVKYLGC